MRDYQPDEKYREDRARYRLRKLGYRLKKTPTRSWLRSYYGPGYQVLDGRNYVIAGCYNREYELTLEQIEDFISDREAKAAADAA